MAKFVIFASARTGSTSLSRVLGDSADVKMAIEPFHPGFPDWNPGEKKYSELITGPASMNTAIDELFSRYDAIKVCDYQFPKAIYFTLLKRNDLRVLFLTRRSLAAMAVSSQIALQTGEWHKSSNNSVYDNLKSVDLRKITKTIEDIGGMNMTYAKFLEANKPHGHMKLFYEELYSEALEQNLETLESICTFVGISLPSHDAINKHMAPSNAKINYRDLYKKLPNFNEIVEKFGEI